MSIAYDAAHRTTEEYGTMRELMSGATTYVIALLAMFVSNIDTIVTWGGFVLLIIRLIADTPRAWRAIKEWRQK